MRPRSRRPVKTYRLQPIPRAWSLKPGRGLEARALETCPTAAAVEAAACGVWDVFRDLLLRAGVPLCMRSPSGVEAGDGTPFRARYLLMPEKTRAHGPPLRSVTASTARLAPDYLPDVNCMMWMPPRW